MTKRLVALVFGSLAALSSRAAHADLKVVATVPDLAALAQEVGGKNASVTAIALADAGSALRRCETQPGAGSEQGRSAALDGLAARDRLAADADHQFPQRGDPGGRPGLPRMLAVRAAAGRAQTTVDRSMGDIHPGGNPHYLYDPRAARGGGQGDRREDGRARPGKPRRATKPISPRSSSGWKRRDGAGKSGWRHIEVRRSSATTARWCIWPTGWVCRRWSSSNRSPEFLRILPTSPRSSRWPASARPRARAGKLLPRRHVQVRRPEDPRRAGQAAGRRRHTARAVLHRPRSARTSR